MEKSNYIFVGVDPQNDFIDGSLAVAEAEQIIKPVNSIADEIRKHDGTVVFTRDWHPEKTPHFDKWPVHCVANTRGADFHKDLNIQPDDIIINKGVGQTDGYSGWEGRSDKGETLESIITPKTPHEKVKVFLGGLATDFCVKSTALDITEHFKDDRRVTTYLLIDAIRAVGLTPTAEEEALSAMKEAGILAISTEEAKKMIQEAI
ncbi:isochorismatase family protein [TM7 phylum sp. oral taxon 352]|jgi:Amidases related to nicotinamidase|nr:isochorismatase family protein [TM7 phylum sp. oral taxon 352]